MPDQIQSTEYYTCRQPIECNDDTFHLCLQGANIAKENGDWGISWFEILTRFYLTTGWRCPIKTGGAGTKAKYVPYDHPKGTVTS